jgi:O-antigen ligase
MTHAERRGDLIVAGGLFGLALLLGGGSVFFPIQRMAVELTAVVALGWFCIRGWRTELGRASTIGLILVGATMLLILAQLVPLPPAWWRALPGRALPADILATIGAPDQWMPITLNPTATKATLFYFLVPAMLYIATLHLGRGGHRILFQVLTAFAIINALLVVLQAQGVTALTLYWTTPTRPGFGLFANKNHCAAFLVAAMPIAVSTCVHLLRDRSAGARYMASAVMLTLLSVTVFGCLSRAGLALMPIGLGSALLILLRDRLSRRTFLWSAVVLVVILVLAFFILPRTYIVAETLQRFGADREGRYDFWPDVLAAIRTYAPVGSGLGTFVPVFTLHETLENVHLTYTNHAHSDYLEIVLETGGAGAVLVAAFLLWFVLTAAKQLRDNWATSGFDLIAASATAILVLLIHSGLDYPLRTLALSGLFAVAAAVLASPAAFRSAMSSTSGYGRRQGSRKRSR